MKIGCKDKHNISIQKLIKHKTGTFVRMGVCATEIM